MGFDKQVIAFLIALLLVCVQSAFASLPYERDPQQKQRKQKKKQQKQERQFFCGTPFVTWTVDAEGEVIFDQQPTDVDLGQAIRKVTPGYPFQARLERVEGDVVIEATLSKAGEVVSIKSISGPTALIEASTQAAQGWRFTPTTLSGEPVEASARMTFKYDLGQEKHPQKNLAKYKK